MSMNEAQLRQYHRFEHPHQKAAYLVQIHQARDLGDAFDQMRKRRQALAQERKLRAAALKEQEQKRIEQARGPYFD